MSQPGPSQTGRRSPATSPAQYLAPQEGYRGAGGRGVYAASRSERSASPAEEYPASPLAADAPTRCSMGDPGIVTRLMPGSPRPFSLPEAATSTERQPISMTRQPRRSTVTPVAPPVIAELSSSLQLLRAGASSSSPSTSTSIRPPAVREQTEALPHGSEAAEPTNGGSRLSRPVSELPIGASPLSSLSRPCRLVVGRKRGTGETLRRLSFKATPIRAEGEGETSWRRVLYDRPTPSCKRNWISWPGSTTRA